MYLRGSVLDSAVIKSRLNRSESVSELLENMVRLGDDAGNATLFGVPEKLHDFAAAVVSMAREARLWRGTIMATYQEREEYTIAEHRASMVRIPVSLINNQDFAKKLNRACCDGVQKVTNYYDLESIANTLIGKESSPLRR